METISQESGEEFCLTVAFPGETRARMADAAWQASWPAWHPASEDRCHVEDGPAISRSQGSPDASNCSRPPRASHEEHGSQLARGHHLKFGHHSVPCH
jgi:hypothetical protein